MTLSKEYTTDARVRKEVRTLVAAGHQVSLIIWARHSAGHSVREEIDGATIIRIGDGKIIGSLPTTALRMQGWWRAGRKAALRRHAELAIDVLHCHDLDTLPIGAKLRNRLGVPLIYDAHEIYSIMIAGNNPKPLPALADSLEKRLLRHVDQVITVNQPLVDHFLRLTKVPVTMVMNCPEELPNIDAEPKLNEAVGEPLPTLNVLYIGSIGPSRFFPQLIHAVDGLERVHLVVAGKTEGHAIDLAGEVEASSNAEYLGPIPYDDVMQMTNRADLIACFYDPSYPESQVNLATKVFEAMGAGKPCIASKGTYTGRFVQKNDVGYAVDCNQEAIRQALASIRDSREERAAKGRRGRELMKNTFNWNNQAKKLLAVYDNLIART